MDPVRLRIPLILCTFWPGERKIHDFVWAYLDSKPSKSPVRTLRLLNVGRFTTKRANDFRIRQLTAYSPVTENSQEVQAISLAAKGLALSHPERAIPHLLEAGSDHFRPRKDIIITISGYSDEQLEPYYGNLVTLTLGPRGDRTQSEELDRAYDRLVPYAMNRNYKRYDDEDSSDDQPLEGFDLNPIMIWNTDVSDIEISNKIARGIESGNREAVRLVLQSLSFYHSDLHQYYVTGEIAQRDFTDIPHLKEYLISTFRKMHKESNFDIVNAGLDSVYAVTQSNPQYDYQRELISRLEEAGDDLDEHHKVMLEAAAPWIRIPDVLCSIWPGDLEVYDLLWEFFEYESEVMPGMMLDWLDLCQFHMTKETQYRIEQLRIQPISPGSHYASRIIKKATTGLKWVHDNIVRILIWQGVSNQRLHTG